MYFEQVYLGCLAQASYLIGSEGEAAVVDPRRDVDEYIRKADEQGLRIRYVVETHLHADFVSGHRELAERTGAEILIGAKADALFPHRAVKDGDEVRFGRVVLRFLETPGHTPESLSVVVIDTEASPEPKMVLTGDTLFIGDVGRPDLAGARGFTPAQMAGQLYDSLHGKLLKLKDEVEVYPAHGAGSLCGKNISKETSSTIGAQRRSNHALQPMSRDAFVAKMTADLPEQPRYFGDGRRDQPPRRRRAPRAAARPPPSSPTRSTRGATTARLVLDVRTNVEFGAGHVPGALNVGLGGQFASWAGTLVDPAQPVLIVAADEARVEEAVMRLARVGLENVAGSLAGGMDAWRAAGKPVSAIPQISVADLRGLVARGDLQVIDVRRPGEYADGHVPGAVTAPLDRCRRRRRASTLRAPRRSSAPAAIAPARPPACSRRAASVTCATSSAGRRPG